MIRILLVIGILGGVWQGLQAADRPNIVFVMTDDQARWAVGAYGNREIQTPHMDSLARDGALFRNAFVTTPVCSPSRAGFLTGLYATQVGITDWIAPMQAEQGLGLPVGLVTWPQILQRNGYATALVGKWHLGEKPHYHPLVRGFDRFTGFLAGGNRPMDPILEVDGQIKQLSGSLPDILTDEATEFIRTNRERPFAVLLHYRAPHGPYTPVPEEDSRPFEGFQPEVPLVPGADPEYVRRQTRDYYASVHSVDRNLGRLLQSLRDLQLEDRTIVIFTSDHGYNIGHHGIHSKGNGYWIAGGVQGPKRPNMFDTSIQIPLMIRWPGVVRPGTIIEEPVLNLDLFASVLSLAGLEDWRSVRQEGSDFSPLLRGQAVPWRDTVFGQYDLHNNGLAYMRMIRTGRWKLVRHYYAHFMDELYDLENDPEEKRNLYRRQEHASVRRDLEQRLREWETSIGDPILLAGSRRLY